VSFAHASARGKMARSISPYQRANDRCATTRGLEYKLYTGRLPASQTK
jgi:hypothetical protein